MSNQSHAAMIEAVGLCKYFGSFAAILDVSFQVHQREVVAFLGPNGAGKSTTMKVLTGYLAPSAGTARIAGHDMATDRLAGSAKLGYLPENGPLYPDMTPRSLLNFFADARGMAPAHKRQRLAEVVELCSLGSVIGKPIGKLSRGYRQRVGMACVLLHEPDVLILDEPTAGLDPNQIHEVRETIRKLGQSKTILLFDAHFAGSRGDGLPRVVHRRRAADFRRSGFRPRARRPAAGRAFPRVDRGRRLAAGRRRPFLPAKLSISPRRPRREKKGVRS